MPFEAPVGEFDFILDHIVGFDDIAQTEQFSEAGRDTVSAVLHEAAKLSRDILAPLNRPGDEHPTRLENGVMRSSPGFAEGFAALAEGGWVAISAPAEYGGMGLPQTIGQIVGEMFAGACLSLQLNPLLTQGQIEALHHHASEEIKDIYLPPLISGEWSGTMNLSEPQAGSDVGKVATRAVANDDGTYAISGQKIWITWGDADFVSNVCHLVLARLPDAPAGTKGISLFVVPRNLPDSDGKAGERNSLKVVSIEHKLGIHGSPTCVMEYDGATGWLVGAEGGGLAAMFTMMNNARLGVGMQGVGVAEAAYQHAYAYALERVQGPTPGPTGAIFDHADVRRMLASAKGDIFAARSIGLACAKATDMAQATSDPTWAARAALLTPIAKAFGSDIGNEVASTGVQIFGGMGYVEETGAAQFMRDARITPIYEGTNGIQAMDLVGRKLLDHGEAAERLFDEIDALAALAGEGDFADLGDTVGQACEAMREITKWLVSRTELADRFAGATAYLRGFARLLGGYYHLKAAVSGDASRGRLAAYYIRRHIPEVASLCETVRQGSTDLLALGVEDLS